jgi:hypothetical protein
MINRRFGFVFTITGLFFLLITACTASESNPTPTSLASPPDPTALIRQRGEFFSAAGECGFCHTNLRDQSAADVSIDSAWRSSMMANATRDPYYRASVRSEVLAHPHLREVIEEKCGICHIGMAYTTAEFSGKATGMLADGGFLSPEHEFYPLALDGVSCSLCHQIQADGLGTMESYSGGYVIDRQQPEGERLVFGHFPIDTNMAAVMRNASGYDPLEASHVKQSEICAVCHNLFTPYITDDGQISTDLFPEQTPHLEWLHSDYPQSASCQVCHMPAAEGEVALANTGSPKRAPFPRHTFTGGNLYMLDLLTANPQVLSLSASSEHFETARLNTIAQLQNRTAQLQVSVEKNGSHLDIDVNIHVLTGHKFPTSFPSRRAWLHVTVKDPQGQVVFESGQWQPNGKIINNANDLDESQFEPHYTLITDPQQVQIYEAIIGDPHGEVTTTLLRASSYLKDNRLLPSGFDKPSATPDIAVFGDAKDDADFQAGGDSIRYQVQLDKTNGPYTIQVELLYQSIGYRWAEKFRFEDNPEGAEFYSYTDVLPNTPVQITSVTLTTQ